MCLVVMVSWRKPVQLLTIITRGCILLNRLVLGLVNNSPGILTGGFYFSKTLIDVEEEVIWISGALDFVWHQVLHAKQIF